MRTLVFIFLLNCLAGCVTSPGKVISRGDVDASTAGVRAEIAGLRSDLKVGGNFGLSSRGITFIAITAILCLGACVVVLRWDSDRRNQRVTERAMLVSRRVKP